MWLHAVAALLMCAHLLLRLRSRDRDAVAIGGEVVMMLGMADMAAGGVVLTPVSWLGFSIVSALAIAACRSRAPARLSRFADLRVRRVHSSLGLILMGLAQVVATHRGVVSVDPGHAHAASPIMLQSVVLLGLGLLAAWCALTDFRAHGNRLRTPTVLSAIAALAMGAGLIVS
ncbi:hypothetical protein [Microbacterium sp. NPDC089695]|uniref:hypothetical protein n=1 Tax=Microbacterium sp. NPDC089695 TaxID=3364198 RepID=UPI0037F51B7A